MTKTTIEYPLPELFWPDDGDPEPMKAPLATIAVYRLGPQGERDQIDYTTLDALPNVNALRDAYGPGLFEVLGRSESGSIVAKRTRRVALKPGQQWRPPAPAIADAAGPAAHSAEPATSSDPMQSFLRYALERNGGDPMTVALFQHVLTLSKELAATSQKSSADMVSAISALAGARIQDQQELFQTLLKTKGAAGGGAQSFSPLDIQKIYESGMKKIQDLYEAGRAAEEENGGGADGDQLALLAKAFVEGMREWRQLQEVQNVVPIRKTNGGGSV